MHVRRPAAGLAHVSLAQSTRGVVEGDGCVVCVQSAGRADERRVDLVGDVNGVLVVDGPERGDDVSIAGELARSGEVDRFVREGGADAGGGAGREECELCVFEACSGERSSTVSGSAS